MAQSLYLECEGSMILEHEEFIERVRKNLLEYVDYVSGHENSKGENAPWVIKSHTTGRIISSHKSKKEAQQHLKQIQMFKHMRGR